ncbi:DUF6446 family protein [Phaeobacter sp. QD34_3]|uniref:DUF6446 family protein n=1 Tax=unclassified Phaeobacter TaxID=2621772 RepID=UPI00237F12BD|nr:MULTISPECIES: DUF6446 family protein [unclassified Phaeobacter]MDE4134053.1 DUF6446 family protein [Phaeobacter sp. QD34_3]MDE4137795.1 DUF6446 family protein [Phaeobacter sp. QD34_24]
MLGKVLAIILGISALVAGASMYYLQVYGFYEDVTLQPGRDVVLTPLDGSDPRPIAYEGFQAIDADSSPIRYRACFTTRLTPQDLAREYTLSQLTAPRNAPGWFDCFDAAALGAALQDGSATAFLSVKNISYGVDRIVAITDQGQGFAWHELNNCGKQTYDGSAIVTEACPERD